ncbi:MAG: acyltransferase [Muribaculaceae bacterium]|nr:acyltransferase [Muribaculaceae bacterium]
MTNNANPTLPPAKGREKNMAVELLKFIAVFLIINSHADVMYPCFSILATGGAIGDCLFLFVSGFTLFLSQPRRFDNYYKRRLRRIFPSVLCSLIFIKAVSPDHVFSTIGLIGGEFILAILIYYFLLYFVRQYLLHRIPLVILTITALTVVVYIFAFPYKYETGERGLYGITTPFRWLPYFIFMLLGAWLGWRKAIGGDSRQPAPMRDFCLLIICLIVFYGLQLAASHIPVVAPWQIVTLLPLAGIIYYLYRWVEAPCFVRIMHNRPVRNVVLAISGLCLESYLIQFPLFTDKLNSIWPLNLLLIALLILVCSYVVRCAARFLLQTTSADDYDWPAIFRLY